MEPYDAVQLARDAISVALVLAAPVLGVGLVVGLVMGLLQAMTQVQEQSVSFVPKLLAMVLTISLTLPWLLTRLVEYWQQLLLNIPNTLGP